jgi:serine/threonine-protein kinase HipA
VCRAQHIEWQDLKMAMGLKSKNKHYHWYSLQPRHWLAMAEYCRFPKEHMQLIMDEVMDKMDHVIQQVTEQLPDNFPVHIASPIFAGMKKIKAKMQF